MAGSSPGSSSELPSFFHSLLEYIYILLSCTIGKVYQQKRWCLGSCSCQNNLICSLCPCKLFTFYNGRNLVGKIIFLVEEVKRSQQKETLFVGEMLPEELINFLTVGFLNLSINLSYSFIQCITMLKSRLVFSIASLVSYLFQVVFGKNKKKVR